MWKLAGCGEMQGRWYLSSWRYGIAAMGEPSTVMRTEWFDSKLAFEQRFNDFWSSI